MVREQTKSTILKTLGLTSQSPEEEEKIFSELENYLWLKLHLEMMDRLSPLEQAELEKLEEGEEVINYISAKIPDLPALMEKTAREGVEELKLSILG